jgi:DNA-binding XRE family transcriptional regulator
MEIAVIAKTRSGSLIRFRRQRKLSQSAAASLAGVSTTSWGAVERMDFSQTSLSSLVAIASLLGSEPEDICPPELGGMKLGMERVMYKHATTERLLAAAGAQARLVAPSPLAVLSSTEATVSEIWDRVKWTLSERHRLVIELRLGLGSVTEPHEWEEIGKIIGVSRERARQIEAQAIRKLQHPVRCRCFEQALDDR